MRVKANDAQTSLAVKNYTHISVHFYTPAIFIFGYYHQSTTMRHDISTNEGNLIEIADGILYFMQISLICKLSSSYSYATFNDINTFISNMKKIQLSVQQPEAKSECV
jgi:hypothetical protein